MCFFNTLATVDDLACWNVCITRRHEYIFDVLFQKLTYENSMGNPLLNACRSDILSPYFYTISYNCKVKLSPSVLFTCAVCSSVYREHYLL